MKRLVESLLNSFDDNANIFVIIKPGFFKYAKDIIRIYEEAGWTLEKTRTKRLIPKEAAKLYEVHKKEDFYEALCEYMCSDNTTALLFAKPIPFSSKVFKEADKLKDIIRRKFGPKDDPMKNVIHSSDSLERLKVERAIYF